MILLRTPVMASRLFYWPPNASEEPAQQFAHLEGKKKMKTSGNISRKALVIGCVVSVIVVCVTVVAAVWVITRFSGSSRHSTNPGTTTSPGYGNGPTTPRTTTSPGYGNNPTTPAGTIDTDGCENKTCLNGGTCEDRVNGFTCHCQPAYGGNYCQNELVGCDSSPCLQGGTCEMIGDNYTCQCAPGNGGVTCQSPQVAFSAYLITTDGLARSWRRVGYEKTWTNLGGSYHNSTFVSPSSDVYYVAMSVNTYSDVSYRLVGAPHALGLSTTSTNLGNRSLGRAWVVVILNGVILHGEFTGNLNGPDATSWSMFSLTAAFHPLVTFTAARTTPTSVLGKVTYAESLVNIGDGYRPADSHFMAPSEGTYFFSLSAGLAPGQGATLRLKKNGLIVIELLNTDSIHNGTEMISSAVLLQLSRGDQVEVELVEGYLNSSPEYMEISFSGFLYSPVHGHAIAWSVWRNSSWTSIHFLRPLPFNVILVNTRDIYSTSEYKVTVLMSGVYCINIVGSARQGGLGMNLVLQYAKVDTIVYDRSANRDGVNTVSRSFLLSLKAGQKIWVLAEGRTYSGVYSNSNLVSGFSGFLVYPT